MTRAHLYITGRVQGVFYRLSTQEKAKKLGLNGWVKNVYSPDFNGVEAVFEGPKDKVEQMVAWCHQGSSASKVDQVRVEWETPENLSGFEIR